MLIIYVNLRLYAYINHLRHNPELVNFIPNMR